MVRTKGRVVATGMEASTKHVLTGSEHCSKHFTSINLGSSQLPSEVGTVVTPFEIKKGGPEKCLKLTAGKEPSRDSNPGSTCQHLCFEPICTVTLRSVPVSGYR